MLLEATVPNLFSYRRLIFKSSVAEPPVGAIIIAYLDAVVNTFPLISCFFSSSILPLVSNSALLFDYVWKNDLTVMYSRKCSLCLGQGESLFKITTTHLKWVLSAARQSHICSVNLFLWALKRPHYIFSLYPQMLFTSPHFLLTGEESNQTKCLSQLPITDVPTSMLIFFPYPSI